MIKPEYGVECVCGGKRIKGRDHSKKMGRLVVQWGLLTTLHTMSKAASSGLGGTEVTWEGRVPVQGVP